MKAGAKIDVIYILSEKSSGSSFLFRSLKDALKIKTYPKTVHFESETLYWTKAASLLDKPQLKMLASAVPYPKARARKEIQDFLKENLNHDIEFESDEDMVFRGWFELVRQFGPVFIEKSPHHLLQWSALELMLEFEERYKSEINCHYICIIRNPKDVFLSQFRRWNVDLRLLENQWLVAYMNWKEFSKQNKPPYNKVAVRYEDFVANPPIKVAEVCSKFGIPAQLNTLEKAKKSKSSNQSEKFGYKLSDSILNLSKRYGYSEDSLTCQSSLYWFFYANYIKFLYSPLKKIYSNFK